MRKNYCKILEIIFVLILFLFPKDIHPESRFLIDDPQNRFRGLSFLQSQYGSGIGGFFEWSIGKSNRIIFNGGFLIISDYPIYDWFTGYYYERPDRKRLTLMPVLLGYKKLLFVNSLANNFRPFLDFSLGPVIGFDPPNIPEFGKRLKQMKTGVTLGARVGGGIDFAYGAGMIMTVSLGYEYLRFPQKLDGANDYSGLIVKFGVGQKF